MQTAKLAGQVLGCHKVVEAEALKPGGTPQAVWETICLHQREDAVLLAGHEPLLSMTVAYLLGAPTLQIDLKKAGLVRLDQDTFGAAPRGTLKWMLAPRLV
jgi:phosphohistidine phosphatase SixA